MKWVFNSYEEKSPWLVNEYCSIIKVIPLKGARDKFCYKRIITWNTGKFARQIFNFITEDRNEETMFSETIPSILLHALWLTGYRVWSTGGFGRTKATAIPMEKVCQRICRTAEKLDMVRIVLTLRNWRTSEGKGLNLKHTETYVPSYDGVNGVE